MKIGTILILTLMISSAVCQDETDGKQEQSERGVVTNVLGVWAIFKIVFGIGFFIFIIVCICCLPCCLLRGGLLSAAWGAPWRCLFAKNSTHMYT